MDRKEREKEMTYDKRLIEYIEKLLMSKEFLKNYDFAIFPDNCAKGQGICFKFIDTYNSGTGQCVQTHWLGESFYNGSKGIVRAIEKAFDEYLTSVIKDEEICNLYQSIRLGFNNENYSRVK